MGVGGVLEVCLKRRSKIPWKTNPRFVTQEIKLMAMPEQNFIQSSLKRMSSKMLRRDTARRRRAAWRFLRERKSGATVIC